MVTVLASLLALLKRSVRKSKGLLLATLVLSTLGASLLTLGVVAATELPASFEEQSARLDTEDLQFSTANPAEADFVAAALQADARVGQQESQPVLQESASFDYAGNDLSLSIIYLDVTDEHRLGRINVVESANPVPADGVFLPLLYKNGSGYREGDRFHVRLTDGTTRGFTVAGFFENPFLGSVSMGVAGLVLPHDAYTRLAAADSGPKATHLVRARLIDPADLDAVSTQVVSRATADAIRTLGQPPDITVNAISLVRAESLNGATIYSVFLMGFAGVIATVIMVVISFLVRTAIMRDMPAIGVQKACGLTSFQIMGSMFLPPFVAALSGVGLGSLVAAQLLPILAAALSAQSGLPWAAGIGPAAVGVSLAVFAGGCLASAVFASQGIHGVAPVAAFQNQGKPHTFDHNPVPLRHARGPLNVLLGLHQGAHGWTQNVAVVVVVGLVSFAAVFSTVLGAEVLGNEQTMRQLTVGETESVTVTVQQDADRADVLNEVRARPQVDRAGYRDWTSASIEGTHAVTSVTETYSLFATTSVYEGREPLHDNEVAVGGKLAQKLNRRIGDWVDVTVGAATRRYLLTGLISTVANAGMRIDLTTDGYRRLVPGYEPFDLAIYLRTTDAADSKEFAARMKTDLGTQLTAVTNTQANVRSALNSYVQLCRALGYGILALNALVICLVMALLVTTMIVRNRRGFGIRKALGFTTANLIVQTLFAYLPAVVGGVALGTLVGFLTTRPLMVTLVASLGVMKLDVPLPPTQLSAVAGGIAALAALLIVLFAGRIRHISAYELFRE